VSIASQAHFGSYSPNVFGWPHHEPTNLVDLDFDGVHIGRVAAQAHGVFMSVLTDLVPLIPGGLYAGKCGAYSTTDDLPDGSWSFHHYGIAIDLNWQVNVMGRSTRPTGRYALPAATSAIARKWGCEWGGDWTYPKDWMHIEVHLTPQVAATIKAPEGDDMPTTDEIAHDTWAYDQNNAKGKQQAWWYLQQAWQEAKSSAASARAAAASAAATNRAVAALATKQFDYSAMVAEMKKQGITSPTTAQLTEALSTVLDGATIDTDGKP
jgi:hypothetical protein